MKWDLLTAPVQLLLIPLLTLKDAISPPSSMTLNKRLGVAVLWNRVTIAEMALKKGASPHCDLHGGAIDAVSFMPSDFGGTPAIFSAANRRLTKITDMLIAAGADINAKTDYGSTALLSAVRSGKPRTVRFLLERGADATITDAKGKSALDYAREKKLADIERLLSNPPAPVAQAAAATMPSGAAQAFNGQAVTTAQPVVVSGPIQLKKPQASATP
ncbi:MAG: ankyrin repeat domain-containing protein [Alphaproteobacteria bacterium]